LQFRLRPPRSLHPRREAKLRSRVLSSGETPSFRALARHEKRAAFGQKSGDLRHALIVSQRRHASSWRQYRHFARASMKAKPPSARSAAGKSTPRTCIIRSINAYRRRSCSCVGHNNLAFDIAPLAFSAGLPPLNSQRTALFRIAAARPSLRHIKPIVRNVAARPGTAAKAPWSQRNRSSDSLFRTLRPKEPRLGGDILALVRHTALQSRPNQHGSIFNEEHREGRGPGNAGDVD